MKTKKDERKGVCYRITKYFRGGKADYWAFMPVGMKMRWGYWEKQLERWGSLTDGGHEDGWRLHTTRIGKCNRVFNTFERDFRTLRFDPDYLEKSTKTA